MRRVAAGVVAVLVVVAAVALLVALDDLIAADGEVVRVGLWLALETEPPLITPDLSNLVLNHFG